MSKGQKITVVSIEEGHKGFTKLLDGKRLPKYHLRPETYGTIDELNSFLGMARAVTKDKTVQKILFSIQNHAACWREYHRIHEANRNQDEATRLVKNYKDRLRYAENRPQRLAVNRAWKAANRERIREYTRQYRERNKERLAAENKAYYDDARDVILMKKRQAYAEGKAA